MIRAAVCDDNKAFLDILVRMADKMLGDNNIPHEMSEYMLGDAFLEHHRKEPFDVVFLDIIMPGTDGFGVAKEIRQISEKTCIIFVTSQSSLVYDSFDFRPFYFVSKGSLDVLKARMSHVVERLAVHLCANKEIYIEMAYGEKKYIEPIEIVSVHSKGNYIDYVLRSGEQIHIRGKIDGTQALLPDRMFARVHSRSMVNMAHIKKIDYPNSKIIMTDGREINISRTYKKTIDEAYNKYLGDFC